MAIATETTPAAYTGLRSPGHNAETVVEVEELRTYLFTRGGVVRAVDDVSFAVRGSETLAIVGSPAAARR